MEVKRTRLRYTAAQRTKQVPGPLTSRTSAGNGESFRAAKLESAVEMVTWYTQYKNEYSAVGGVASRD
jgi:hypothetical protein